MDIPKPTTLRLFSTDESMGDALFIKDSMSLTTFTNFSVKSFISDTHKQISLISVRSCVISINKLSIVNTIPFHKLSSFLLKDFCIFIFPISDYIE